MPVQEDFIEQAAPFRSELLAHPLLQSGHVSRPEDHAEGHARRQAIGMASAL